MERKPLLGRNAQETDPRPCLQSKPSYDQLPQAAQGYYGDNIIIPPDRRRIEDTYEDLEHLTYRDRWPLFIYIISLVNVVLVIFVCVAGGVERVSFTPELEHFDVKIFGFINSTRHSNTSKKVIIHSEGNIFVGPNASFLIHHGAGYTPCIRQDRTIVEELHDQKKKEKEYRCCSVNEECAMQSEEECTDSFHGTIVGGKRNCTSNHPNCSHGITLRPCCVGFFANCSVISEQECTVARGYWHQDKLLCGDVNCLNDVCGMSGVESRDEAKQWYRLITPIFLHLGVLHVLSNLLMQIPVGRIIEKEIGSVRIAVVYLYSGVGGCLTSSIFDPLSPQVGASGALFGLFALMFVLLFRQRGLTMSPCRDFFVLLLVVVVSFLIGTIPYVGNFVHIGGFLFGLLASFFLVPTARVLRCRARNLHCWRLVAVISMAALLVGALLVVYKLHDTEFCSWCHYLDCIPWTKDLCPNVDNN